MLQRINHRRLVYIWLAALTLFVLWAQFAGQVRDNIIDPPLSRNMCSYGQAYTNTGTADYGFDWVNMRIQLSTICPKEPPMSIKQLLDENSTYISPAR